MDNTITSYQLNQFTGTEHWYRHWLGILYTDGVKFLAEKAGAYWLIDAVASYQNKLKDVPFQIWTLVVNEDNSAILQMREDSDMPFRVEQYIKYSDFSLESIRLYFIDNVLLLPSEY